MEPSYREGERVLTFNWGKPRLGDVIVFKQKDKFYIKRVELITAGKITVSGDNKKLSSKFKPIDLRQVVGRVVLKY